MTEQIGNGSASTGSIIDQVVFSVMDMIDALSPFASVTRGALGTKQGICCEIAPSTPFEVYHDKNCYIPLDIAINGKHSDLETLSNALNNIMDKLTRKTSYTSGNGWQIVDITNGNLPQVTGRSDNNDWIMACDLIVKVYRKDDDTE